MEPERSRQNKSFLNQHFVFITCCFEIIGFQNFCFSIVFLLWLACFANQHTKTVETHKLCRLIAPKQMKLDMPCKNKKSLNLSAFSDTSVRFSHEDKISIFLGLFTNSKQRYSIFKTSVIFMLNYLIHFRS